MVIYPLKFKPIYKYRIWGGRKLESFFRKKLPEQQKIGESWELADLPEDKSIIAHGDLAGLTLQEAIRKYPKEVTGDKNFKLPFPLLIKFIDTQDITSVQVHPDAEECRKLGKGEPKTECWYVIDAEPGAFIYNGLKKGVTRENFEEAIKNGNVEKLLEKNMVHPGEYYYLPSGTVHSLGPGILLTEIQTQSDTTYRIYDFNRIEKDGSKRTLHIKDSLESIHFRASENTAVPAMGSLIDCGYFKVEQAKHAAGNKMKISGWEMKVLIVIKGNGKIETANKFVTEFIAGEVILLPADLKGEVIFKTDCEYLSVKL